MWLINASAIALGVTECSALNSSEKNIHDIFHYSKFYSIFLYCS